MAKDNCKIRYRERGGNFLYDRQRSDDQDIQKGVMIFECDKKIHILFANP